MGKEDTWLEGQLRGKVREIEKEKRRQGREKRMVWTRAVKEMLSNIRKSWNR